MQSLGDSKGLPPRMVLAFIREHAMEGVTAPSIDDISLEFDVGRDAVVETLRTLERLGWLNKRFFDPKESTGGKTQKGTRTGAPLSRNASKSRGVKPNARRDPNARPATRR